MNLRDLCDAVRPVEPEVGRTAQARLDEKTKPVGSLGQLERLAVRIVSCRGRVSVEPLEHAALVLAADHGIARAGVSAFPQVVTGQMLGNFASGGAAINVLCRRAGARLVVADLGSVDGNAPAPVLDRRIGPGTQSWLSEPAMTEADARRAIAVGAELASQLANEGVTTLALGEMGIGNTATASLLVAGLTGAPVTDLVGRGTGLSEAALRDKRAVVSRALALHASARDTPLQWLACCGGFEIAGLVGAMLAAAAKRQVIVLDGFIVSSAALVAVRLCPALAGYLVAAHRSAEPGHRIALDTLGLTPLLALDLCLGEGSGAALALPLLDAAVAVLTEMATFESAGVSGTSHG